MNSSILMRQSLEALSAVPAWVLHGMVGIALMVVVATVIGARAERTRA